MGVEPICKACSSPRHLLCDPRPSESARARRDDALKPEIQRVYDASLDGVYGAKKVWKQLNREGFSVARCTTERLMKELGLSGVQKGPLQGHDDRRRRAAATERPRRSSLRGAAPNRLWVADLTYVKSHSGGSTSRSSSTSSVASSLAGRCRTRCAVT